MGTFLQILGAIFLCLILLVLFAVIFGKFLVKRKLEKMVEQVQRAANSRVYEYKDVSRATREDGEQALDDRIIEVEPTQVDESSTS